MIRAVLFDLDGVLVDTRDLHFRALNAALAAHGCRPVSADEHEREFNGLPTREKLERLCNRGRVMPTDVASVAALKQKETRRLLETEVTFDPNVFCLIAGLAAKGYRVGVVTNAVPETAVLVLNRLFGGTLDILATNADGKPKPSPDLYLKAASGLRLDPNECLAVEDGRYGIEAATAAGCRVLQVSCPEEVTPKRIWEALC